jgi:antitoxin SocA-like protein
MNTKKYENAILYLCQSVGGALYGKKKLAKLLYFTDFDRYEYKESNKSITGDTYQKLPMGPFPTHFPAIVDKLVRANKLTITQEDYQPGFNPFEVYTCKTEPDMSVFDEDDIKILNRVSKIYGGLSGKQLEELSHAEAPYLGTEETAEIPYELAYYRETQFDEVSRA